MNHETFEKMAGGLTGVCVSALGITNVDELYSWVGIICSVIGLLITIATTVIIPFIKKLHKAKEDGKITPDEMKDALDDLKNNIDKIDKEK